MVTATCRILAPPLADCQSHTVLVPGPFNTVIVYCTARGCGGILSAVGIGVMACRLDPISITKGWHLCALES